MTLQATVEASSSGRHQRTSTFNKTMNHLGIVTCCICLLGCNDKLSQKSPESSANQSDPKIHFEISKTDLEHIEQINGSILIDTVIVPNERIDVPKSSEFRRIGLIVDQKSDLTLCKGFVSLTGTDGSRLAGDVRSELGRIDKMPITTSFSLKNEGNQARRVIVYTANNEQTNSPDPY